MLDITTDARKIQRLTLKTSIPKHLENLVEMDKYTDTYDLPKLNGGNKQLKEIYNKQRD